MTLHAVGVKTKSARLRRVVVAGRRRIVAARKMRVRRRIVVAGRRKIVVARKMHVVSESANKHLSVSVKTIAVGRDLTVLGNRPRAH
jgi:hypothetical protein